MVARIGGDEFAILLADTPEEECIGLVARIRSRIERFNAETSDLRLSLSIGRALWKQGEPKDLQNLFKIADDRMFKDKMRRVKR